MTMLLHFHLGPAGGFIDEARRTRDYWAGSFLLSWLTGKAMSAASPKREEIILPVVQEEVEGASGASLRALLRTWVERISDGRTFLVDPTLAAIDAAAEMKTGRLDGPFLGTLTNHFTAEFNTHDEALAAGKAAAEAVREAWKTLADIVREVVLDDFDFLTNGASPGQDRRTWEERAQKARVIWDRQIGDGDFSPFWEIYWVVAPAEKKKVGDVPWSPLDSRKLTRWSPDMVAALPQDGNFCTMFAHFVDVSGIERRQGNKAFGHFWSKMRAHLNKVRYRRENLSDDACLDLRPNESLSAPALVKRLFPLLAIRHADALEDAIGWSPEVRNAMPAEIRTLSWFAKGLRALSSEEEQSVTDVPASELDTQSALFWPSTSYIAATHWIARAQRSAPKGCIKFRYKLDNFAHQYAVAEQSLWLRAVHEPFANFKKTPPLAFVDGAMLHETRLKLATGGIDAERAKALEALKAIRDCIAVHAPGHLPRAYFHVGMKVGPPPSYYAIIRADGDHVGPALANASRLPEPQATQARRAISRLFIGWASDMRGKAPATSREEISQEDRLGPIAANNGVLLYAGADELLVFAPAEDAFDIACAIQESFVARRAEIAKPLAAGNKVAGMTISVCVLYAHIRAPLRWAIHESKALLDEVAKDAADRNALALALFDIDGHRSRWAAQWGTAQIGAFEEVLRAAYETCDWLWSNEFYHRVADALRAFTVPELYADYVTLVEYLRGNIGGLGRPNASDRDIVKSLVDRCVADKGGGEALAKCLFDLLTPFNPKLGATRENVGHVTLAPLDILRVLGTNWCKDEDDYNPVADAAPGSEPPQ